MSLSYRLGSNSLFIRPHEDSIEPKRVVFLSTEGTKTEVQYFHFIEQYREQLGIDAIIHIEVLRRHDTNSDPENVLDLLEEYIHFRENNIFEKSIATVYKGNIIKNLIMDCQSYTKYRPNETTGGIFVSWRRKEELPTGA